MNFAPGVEFCEDAHEYWYRGKQLSGVTGLIGKRLGLKIPKEFVEEHREEGIHVHKAVQHWIRTGKPGSVHSGVRWLVDTWHQRTPSSVSLHSEVLVTDFTRYASAIDIVQVLADNSLVLYDVKKGVFKRDYVTWQLSIYRYFVERYAGGHVTQCVCICLKDREYYPIVPKEAAKVENLLYR